MAPDSRIVQTKLTDLEERPGVGEQLGALVCRAPLVAELGRAPLPRLEVEGRPDHVEEGEQHEGEVLQELSAAAEEELQFPRVVNDCQRGFKVAGDLLTQTRKPTRAGMQRAEV